MDTRFNPTKGTICLRLGIILGWQPDKKRELSLLRRRARPPSYIGGTTQAIPVQVLASHEYGQEPRVTYYFATSASLGTDDCTVSVDGNPHCADSSNIPHSILRV
jgi:hypothetical protein